MAEVIEVVLGLDAGTTSAKAVVMDQEGAIWAEAESDPIPTCSPEPGASEQDPEEVWQAVASAARGAVGRLPTGVRVAALAVAAQSGSVVPVRASGRVGPVITWMDARSRALVEGWPPETAERIRAVSGWTPTAGYGLSTIARLMSRSGPAQPDSASPPGRANRSNSSPGSEASSGPVIRWASVDDYLMHRLAGRWATNPSNASGMGLMDVSARTWNPELCRIAGTDPSVLSEIVESGAAAGGLIPEAAAALGVPAGTPVAAGGHDQACAALGLGAVEPGRVFLSAGTAWVLTTVTDRACASALPPRLNLSPHVIADRWTVSESLGGLGAEIAEAAPEKIQAVFERCARRVTEALTRATAAQAASGDELIPVAGDESHLLERRAQAEASGDELIPVAGDESHRLERQAQAEASDELILVGGGGRFSELVEVIAESTGRSVVAWPDASWPARGAALLAASSLGWELSPGWDLLREPSRGEPIPEAAR